MNCPHCNNNNHNAAVFCSKCGKRIVVDKETDYKVPLNSSIIFLSVIIIYWLVLYLSSFGTNYKELLLMDLIFAGIVMTYFFIYFKSSVRLFKLRKKKIKILVYLFIFGVAFSFIVNLLADFINYNVFNVQDVVYIDFFADSRYPVFFTVLSIGFFPAVFEEIAFRGVLFNQLSKFMRLKHTIVLTSVMFTIIHFSPVSALWILPLGLIMGYLRAKYRSVIYGIFLHFVYNTSFVFYEIILN